METQPSSPKRGRSPQFSAHIYSGQMAGWIKLVLGMEVGLSAVDFVLDGDPAPLPKKGAKPLVFGPCPLWPNGWMGQDGTWHGGGLSPRYIVLDWDPATRPKKVVRNDVHTYVCIHIIADNCHTQHSTEQF